MRRTLTRAAAALAAVLALPAAAWADSGGKADPLTPSLVNSIVTLVVFGALLGVLYKFAWGPILAGLKTREEAERKKVEDTAKARDEAAALRVQLQAELAKANEQVRAMIEEARRDAAAMREEEKRKGVEDAAAERDRARAEIAAAKDAALSEIYTTAVDLATSLSAKTLARQVTADDHRRFLDEALAELRQTAKTA